MVYLIKCNVMIKFVFKQYKPTNVVQRISTPIDDFHFDEISPSHSVGKAVVVSNPLCVIFNAKRLSSVGDINIQDWIDSMDKSHSDSLKELRSKLSDEDLISLLRSRYCQSPCEISQWTEYLVSTSKKFNEEVQSMIEQLNAQNSESSDEVQSSVESVSKSV